MKLGKTTVSAAAITVCAIVVALFLWNRLASRTEVALVNFSSFQTASICLANDNPHIRYTEVSADKFSSLKRYDCILNFAMGLKITEDQRAELQQAADKDVPVLSFAVTNPANAIDNIDSLRRETLLGYLQNGNKRNYRSLANYIRNEIDGKKFFRRPADEPVENAFDVFYDIDENVAIDSLGKYEQYCKEKGFYTEGGPKIVLFNTLNDAFSGNRENIDSMITAFRKAGFNVYPVAAGAKRLQFLEAVQPDAVLYFAHGRLGSGDAAVEWLARHNVPLFAPLTMMTTREKWEGDPMGMYGGFLSQSIVMPEIDGGTHPYVLTLQEQNKEGLYLFKAAPERVRNFTEILGRFFELKRMANRDKKVAIFFFKGPGQTSLTAAGSDVESSLYNLLKRLRSEGYDTGNLPDDPAVFNRQLASRCALFNTYAEGAFDEFLRTEDPLLVGVDEYEAWAREAMPEDLYEQVTDKYGAAPGNFMRVVRDGKEHLAVACLRYGNVVLLPQPMAGLGGDSFAIVHGADAPPPHTYIAPYLWMRYGFKADALIHFGTHGSLEFTPKKQVALCRYDWPEILTGTVPHFYYYTIGNVGESIMAKRRSYATLITYLTPPFSESKTRGQYKELTDAIQVYYDEDKSEAARKQASLKIKKLTIAMGIHRDLKLDSLRTEPYSSEEIEKIENFAEEIAGEKVITTYYVTGVPFTEDKIRSTVMAMSADPVAYSLAALDRIRGRVTPAQLERRTFFTKHYGEPARAEVRKLLQGKVADSVYVAQIAGVRPADIRKAKELLQEKPSGMMAMMGRRPAAPEKQPTAEEKEWARALVDIERTLTNVQVYRKGLQESPEKELRGFLNAMSGGYIRPSSGGDAVANPNAVPTGRNLYAINAEATPSKEAWEKGRKLGTATVEDYRKRNGGTYPRKICFSFWSSEFIETEGATIAQAFYLLGVEPVWDAFGRVSDLKLIPAAELGRPRIDIVVQTSGQFRDLAASRLELLSRAVRMAAAASGEGEDNFVSQSTTDIEKQLVDAGIPPATARDLSTRRVFGGLNGMYGTGIQEMIKSSDRWESEQEIAEVYLNNMGASYDDPKNWGAFDKNLLRAVLHNTDAIVHPRQSNTWGALSLDHVYEFMGGMNLTIRSVTGKDPEAYFSDYRNRHNVHIQELKEAIGVESRATVFNPEFLKEAVQNGRTTADRLEEIVTNTFGWSVTKPDVIDQEMWDRYYDVYIRDSYGLHVPEIFEQENPMALQEITAIMLEMVRKGMWEASEEQIADLTQLHTRLVSQYGSNGQKFAGGNPKLQEYVAGKVDPETASRYRESLKKLTEPAGKSAEEKKGMVLEKERTAVPQASGSKFNGVVAAAVVLVLFVGAVWIIRRRRGNRDQ